MKNDAILIVHREPNKPLMIGKDLIESTLTNEELGLYVRLLWISQQGLEPSKKNYSEMFKTPEFSIETAYQSLVDAEYLFREKKQ